MPQITAIPPPPAIKKGADEVALRNDFDLAGRVWEAFEETRDVVREVLERHGGDGDGGGVNCVECRRFLGRGGDGGEEGAGLWW